MSSADLDVVYVPTPRETVDRMLQITEVGSEGLLIDLGSGDGRIVVAAGRRRPGAWCRPRSRKDSGCRAQCQACRRRRPRQLPAAEPVRHRYFGGHRADALSLPSINLKLRPKILSLRPGTRVVTHDFRMGDWKPDLSETVNWRIHLWIVPARSRAVAGECG